MGTEEKNPLLDGGFPEEDLDQRFAKWLESPS